MASHSKFPEVTATGWRRGLESQENSMKGSSNRADQGAKESGLRMCVAEKVRTRNDGKWAEEVVGRSQRPDACVSILSC